MRILVLSDSHGNRENIRSAVSVESPELILHLGDHAGDCAVIEQEYPELPFRCVRGNCDRGSAEPDTDEFTLDGIRFFMTHGHMYHVKFSKTSVIQKALKNSADVLLFGHTHIPYNSKHDDLLVINPGSIGSSEKSYAVLEIRNGVVSCELMYLM